MKKFLLALFFCSLIVGIPIGSCVLACFVAVYYFGVRWTVAFNVTTFSIAAVMGLSMLLIFVFRGSLESAKDVNKAKPPKSRLEELLTAVSSFFF